MGIRKTIDDAKKSKELWWISKINRYFYKQSGVEVVSGMFRPSGISPCMRENQYCYAGFAKYPSNYLSSVKRMKRGTEHHKIWEQIFVDAEMDVLSGGSVPVTYASPVIRGTPDWLVKHESKIFLFEWKSTANVTDPEWGQLVQWSLYAYLLNACYDLGVEYGWIVKENPADFDLYPIPMFLENDFVESLLGELLIVENCCKNKEIVPIDSRCGQEGKWRFSCPLYDFCHSESGDDPWKTKEVS